MQVFCQLTDLSASDLPISSWQDAVLAPKNQNITHIHHQKPFLKPYHRRHNFVSKRMFSRQQPQPKVSRQANIQNIQSQICHKYLPEKKEHQRQSNITKLKYKIQNLDKDFDRWEERSMTKLTQIPINATHRRAHSGVFKTYTQQEPKSKLSLCKTYKYQSKSIQQSSGLIERVRPVSSRTESANMQSVILGSDRERSRTIHSKPRLKSHSYSRQLTRQRESCSLFTINQLQSGKMKHIMSCLSQRK